MKSKWGKLTDDDIQNVAGKRDVLIGKLQTRYGVLKDDAEKQVNAWLEKFAPVAGKQNAHGGDGNQAS